MTDDLDQREALLRAVFDAPGDDLPRLVFADWLEERGDVAFAERLRRECEVQAGEYWRGFEPCDDIAVGVSQIGDAAEFRRLALSDHPEWYGSPALKLVDGLIGSAKPIQTILTSTVTQKVARLDLSGSVIQSRAGESADEDSYQLLDFEYLPRVTVQAVVALVGSREARRLTHLDLTNNDLDNDAARAIINSPYLTRLQSLAIFDGNQLRGKTWAQLRQRFGEDALR